MKKQLSEEIMKFNFEYQKRKIMMKDISERYAQHMKYSLIFITPFLLSLVGLYIKIKIHKDYHNHLDIIELGTLCAVQVNVIHPVHIYLGKFILSYLMRSKLKREESLII